MFQALQPEMDTKLKLGRGIYLIIKFLYYKNNLFNFFYKLTNQSKSINVSSWGITAQNGYQIKI